MGEIMHIEACSESHILTGPDPNLDIRQLNEPNIAVIALTVTPAEVEVADKPTIPVCTQIAACAPSVVDSKSRPRRRASPRHANGSGPSSEVAAVNHATNSDGVAIGNCEGRSRLAGGSDKAADEEAVLAEQIGQLWFSVQLRARAIRKNSKERAAFKDNLARDLHRYKALLVHSGRFGKWSAFLRRNEIPRATADRYVEKWQRTLTQVVENRLAEPISPPTAEEVTRMVNRIKPKLLRVLITADAVEQFLAALGAALQVPRSS
jgi:hypothetical protein